MPFKFKQFWKHLQYSDLTAIINYYVCRNNRTDSTELLAELCNRSTKYALAELYFYKKRFLWTLDLNQKQPTHLHKTHP